MRSEHHILTITGDDFLTVDKQDLLESFHRDRNLTVSNRQHTTMSEGATKKRRKSEDPAAKSSKRQKTLAPDALAARNLPKPSSVPYPAETQDASSKATSSSQQDLQNGHPVRSQASPTPSATTIKRTPILPPPLSSPLKKTLSSDTSKTKKKAKVAEGRENGMSTSKRSETPRPPKKTPIVPPQSPKNGQPANGAGVQPATKEGKVKKKKENREESHSENHLEGNMDVTNDITGRELPEPGDETVVVDDEDNDQVHMELEQPKKKRKMEQMSPPKEIQEESLPPSSEAESELVGSNGAASFPVKKGKSQKDLDQLDEIRTQRLERNKLNINQDFGLEGVLEIPPAGTYNTGFHYFQISMYLDVPPIGVGYPLEAAVSLNISRYLFEYFPPGNGILMCHTNHRICPAPGEKEESLTKIAAGYADNHIWISTDLYIFRPTKGAYLRGTISLQTESHIAIRILGHWTAAVERKRLPKNWRWVPDDDDDSSLIEEDYIHPDDINLGGAGHWSDGNGTPVRGQVTIRALDYDMVNDVKRGGTVMSIEASMLDEEDDRLADEIDELSNPRLLTRSSGHSRLLAQSHQAPAAGPSAGSSAAGTSAGASASANGAADSSRASDVDAMDIDMPLAGTPPVSKSSTKERSTSKKKKEKQPQVQAR